MSDVNSGAAEGAHDKETAERSVVSEKTRQYHLSQICTKLSATGGTEAVARARGIGLSPLDSLPS